MGRDDPYLWDGRLVKMEVSQCEPYSALNFSSGDQQTTSRLLNTTKYIFLNAMKDTLYQIFSQHFKSNYLPLYNKLKIYISNLKIAISFEIIKFPKPNQK